MTTTRRKRKTTFDISVTARLSPAQVDALEAYAARHGGKLKRSAVLRMAIEKFLSESALVS